MVHGSYMQSCAHSLAQRCWWYRPQALLQIQGQALQPFQVVCRFVRMPGGCYVEGVRLETAAWWKPSVGPFWEHYNSVWNYWSTDGTVLVSLCEVMLIMNCVMKCFRGQVC